MPGLGPYSKVTFVILDWDRDNGLKWFEELQIDRLKEGL